MKMTRSEDYLKELEEMLQTISIQHSDIADRRKVAVFKNLKIIVKGIKASLQEGDFLLSRISIVNPDIKRDQSRIL
jgi:hypothetical protein